MDSEDRLETVRRLIEESSLGTEGARTLRARTTPAVIAELRRRRGESANQDGVDQREPGHACIAEDTGRPAFPGDSSSHQGPNAAIYGRS
jgi:hypothetical protein